MIMPGIKALPKLKFVSTWEKTFLISSISHLLGMFILFILIGTGISALHPALLGDLAPFRWVATPSGIRVGLLVNSLEEIEVEGVVGDQTQDINGLGLPLGRLGVDELLEEKTMPVPRKESFPIRWLNLAYCLGLGQRLLLSLFL